MNLLKKERGTGGLSKMKLKELAEWSLRTKENSANEDTTVIKEPSVVESDGNVLTVVFTSHKKNYDA